MRIHSGHPEKMWRSRGLHEQDSRPRSLPREWRCETERPPCCPRRPPCSSSSSSSAVVERPGWLPHLHQHCHKGASEAMAPETLRGAQTEGREGAATTPGSRRKGCPLVRLYRKRVCMRLGSLQCSLALVLVVRSRPPATHLCLTPMHAHASSPRPIPVV